MTSASGGSDPTIEKLRAAEHRVNEIETSRQTLHQQGLAAMGMTGNEVTVSLREGIRRSGTGWYPLVILSVLLIVDGFQGTAFGILSPDISRTLGITKAELAGVVTLQVLATTLLALPIAASVQRRARRAAVSIATALGWSLFTVFTGFVTSVYALGAVLVADGASTASVSSIHQPFLMDLYPPSVRVRALSVYNAVQQVGRILSPLLVGALTLWLALTWRGIFVVMGLLSLAATLFALRLRDPGFGRWDTAKVRSLADAEAAPGDTTRVAPNVQLSFFDIVKRLLM
ncbi:MAG: MFS transporter, partial [Candidatus Dormibacteria bacterium]